MCQVKISKEKKEELNKRVKKLQRKVKVTRKY